MRLDQRVQLVAASVLVVSLVASGVLSAKIVASVGRHDLSYTDRAEEGDPPQVALGIAMGAFRGLFVNILWIRANNMKEEGKFYEAIELAKAITRLQPRFPRVWAFHAWNNAYNISVSTQTPEERYQWVMSGVRLLRDEGIIHNPNDMLLHKELAWIYLHKIGGYTDDANQYYKRKVAEEWTIVMGTPRVPIGYPRDRESMIEFYADRLHLIVDAPYTEQALVERNPPAGELLDTLRSIFEEDPISFEFLRMWTDHEELESSGRAVLAQASFGEKHRTFSRLKTDPRLAEAWDALIPFVRKRLLMDNYNMEPVRMLRFTERFGPLDWRHPAAHGCYWGQRGVEVGRMEVDAKNSEAFDFVNTYRMTMQSLQELYRNGEVYFNYIDFRNGEYAYYQAMPNPVFIPSYGEIIKEVAASTGIFGSERRAQRPFASGYENFLKDAIRLLYRRGQRAAAEGWYEELITFEEMNLDAVNFRAEEYAVTLDEFVERELFDRYTSPQVAVSEVMGGLQAAFAALLIRDSDSFRGSFEYAKQVHKFYMKNQYRQVVAGGGDGRTEYMDRDFEFLAGGIFSNMITIVGIDEAELMYFNATTDLQQAAYDSLADRYKVAIDTMGKETGKAFEHYFPEPPGMAQYRVEHEAKARLRSGAPLDGLQQK